MNFESSYESNLILTKVLAWQVSELGNSTSRTAASEIICRRSKISSRNLVIDLITHMYQLLKLFV